MSTRDYSFDSWLEEKLLDPRFNRAYQRYATAAEVAAQISLLRKSNGLTQSELARRIKSSQEVVSRLERASRGSVTVQTLERLAQAFGKRLEIRFL